MSIKNMFVWYQQKLGTYDKQKWETKIEQREQRIYGLTHIQTRSTKPNTDLIDLDLVRGSSFTKAKPQHGFIKVVKLATLRCMLYPFYGKWWVEQTTLYVFLINLVVYILQLFNIFLYFTHNNEGISSMEIIVPFIMMWMLSLIHSQIVATRPAFEPKKNRIKRRQYKRKSSSKKKQKQNIEDNDCDSKTTLAKNKEKLNSCTKRLTVNIIQDRKDVTNENSRLSGEECFLESNINYETNASDKIQTTLDTTGQKLQRESLDNYYRIKNKPLPMNKHDVCITDSESEIEGISKPNKKTLFSRRNTHTPTINITSTVESPDETEDDMLLSPGNKQSCTLLGDISSATEWMGVTTNSEECSYSSDIDHISVSNTDHDNDYMGCESDLAPTAILNPPSLKVSCVIWERNDIRKADLSMLDISSAIIRRVDLMAESMDYFYIGIFISTVLAFLPVICKISNNSTDLNFSEIQHIMKDLYKNVSLVPAVSNNLLVALENYENIIIQLLAAMMKYLSLVDEGNMWELVMVISLLQRWILACMVFFLLCVAERTFKQRLLYAKLFSHLTSSRRARKSDLPHFRLNKVRNIKTWLSVRAYLKKRGPQRSVDVIVSTAFIVNLLLLIFLCVELLKDTVVFSQYYLEALIWCLGLGTLLLRFMTLGTKINKKYRNLSVLITEQINLHLQIEQKPHKKDEFTVANNVLKLAIDLLKELENPFKISGLSANPILYNVTKLVILSALSGVFSEMLGFKLKLHKIKLK